MRTTRKYIVEKQCCGTCAHYRQHYVLGGGGQFSPLWYGHCHSPHQRYPQPDGVCPKWKGREEEREPGSQG